MKNFEEQPIRVKYTKVFEYCRTDKNSNQTLLQENSISYEPFPSADRMLCKVCNMNSASTYNKKGCEICSENSTRNSASCKRCNRSERDETIEFMTEPSVPVYYKYQCMCTLSGIIHDVYSKSNQNQNACTEQLTDVAKQDKVVLINFDANGLVWKKQPEPLNLTKQVMLAGLAKCGTYNFAQCNFCEGETTEDKEQKKNSEEICNACTGAQLHTYISENNPKAELCRHKGKLNNWKREIDIQTEQTTKRKKELRLWEQKTKGWVYSSSQS